MFTLEANDLPGGRGQGEPVRLMLDLEERHGILETFAYGPGPKLLVASEAGYGFVVPEDEVAAGSAGASRFSACGRPTRRKVCLPVDGDYVAAVGENRKMLMFPLAEVHGDAARQG